MAVTKVKFVLEVDNTPEEMDAYGELPQGTTYENYLIFELYSNNNTKPQYLRIPIEHDSYGQGRVRPQEIKLVEPTTKTVTVFE